MTKEAYTWDVDSMLTEPGKELYSRGPFVPCSQDEHLEVNYFGMVERSREYTQQLHEFIAAQEPHSDHASHTIVDHVNAPYRATGPDEIRVFRLYPAAFDGPLRGRLEHVHIEFSFEDIPSDVGGTWTYGHRAAFGLSLDRGMKVPYTAVSYAWGSSDFTHPLMIDGTSIKVTETVDVLLRHIRLANRPVTLWLDQICINQNDRADKEAQVKLMGSIYRRARNTIVWLGQESGIEAFTVLKGLYEATYGVEELLDDKLDELRYDSKYQHGFGSLLRLLEHPWFQRTWVIQEVILSRDIYIMTGHDTVSWDLFSRYCSGVAPFGLIQMPAKTTHTERLRASGVDIVVDVASEKSYYDTHGASKYMLSWLLATRYAAVGLPVDKIYALLGVCNSDILPLYTKLCTDLYHEVATSLIAEGITEVATRKLRMEKMQTYHLVSKVLSCVDHDPEADSLPSWAPDWSLSRRTSSLGYATSCYARFDAGRTTDLEVFRFDRGRMHLSMQALQIGVIEELSSVCTDVSLTIEKPLENNGSLRDSVVLAARRAPVLDKYDGLFVTFCSTLVPGTEGDPRGMGDGFPKEYIEILSLLCDESTGTSPSIPGQTYTARQLSPEGHRGRFSLHHPSQRQTGRFFKSLQIAFKNALYNRRLCWLKGSVLGLVPSYAKEGDIVYVVPGYPVPFVVRSLSHSRWQLVGECYVHAVMHGEAMDSSPPLEDLVLV
ncbi:WD repeat-containing protein jip5 [Recurvomyces mirabilis]|nr:WD repeat-containing protein jip5 [Recurvomyces mirabilis]